MGEKADTLGLAAFETLPWACRFNDWGKTATVLGTKAGPNSSTAQLRQRERERSQVVTEKDPKIQFQ